jgi:deaminated glutathione amidase
VNVALAQFAPTALCSDNIAALTVLAQDAHRRGAEIFVAPEYAHAFIPGGGRAWAQVSQTLDGEFVTALADLSSALDGMVMVAGMLERGDADLPFNTIVAVNAGGVVARATKLHLYDAFGAQESESVTPGVIGAPQVLRHGPLRIGMQACYDLRFPEVTRALVDAGANTIVVPAQWVPGDNKVSAWQTLLRARAIESQSFVVAAGQPLPHGIGHSSVINPVGHEILEMGGDSNLALATLDPSLVTDAREANPMARARRFDVVPRG